MFLFFCTFFLRYFVVGRSHLCTYVSCGSDGVGSGRVWRSDWLRSREIYQHKGRSFRRIIKHTLCRQSFTATSMFSLSTIVKALSFVDLLKAQIPIHRRSRFIEYLILLIEAATHVEKRIHYSVFFASRQPAIGVTVGTKSAKTKTSGSFGDSRFVRFFFSFSFVFCWFLFEAMRRRSYTLCVPHPPGEISLSSNILTKINKLNNEIN